MQPTTIANEYQSNDEIVIKELKQQLDILLTPDKDEGGCYFDLDLKLIDAMKLVLGYYLSQTEETEQYFRQVNLLQLASMAVINGEY